MPLFHFLPKGCVLEFSLGAGKKEAPLTRAHSKPACPSHAHMNTHASTCATPTPSLSSPLTNTHAHVHGDRS